MYTNFVLLLDNDKKMNALSVESKLSLVDIKIRQLPKGVEDPGDMTKKQIESFAVVLREAV